MCCHLIGHAEKIPFSNFPCMDGKPLTFPTCKKIEKMLFLRRIVQVLRDHLGMLMALIGFSRQFFNLSLYSDKAGRDNRTRGLEMNH